MNRLLVFALLLGLCLPVMGQTFVIITLNPEIEALHSNQVKMLYRGRISSINGVPTRLMDLPRDSAYRTLFYQQLLNKTPSQMSAIWARQSFSGNAVAPIEIKDESKIVIVNWLRNNANGIAYVPEHLLPEDAYVIYKFTE
ncbi:hypothetical protein [Vibrio sp. TRT 1302]|uniref:hypothetical protein n=1 Tax=Vibrio sp. TRT 1302 TaxID=3418504 RepID=UPI003CF72D23